MKFNVAGTEFKSQKLKDPHIIIEKYGNLPFMPQKNEENDRKGILMHSKEFNPVISLPASKETRLQSTKIKPKKQ